MFMNIDRQINSTFNIISFRVQLTHLIIAEYLGIEKPGGYRNIPPSSYKLVDRCYCRDDASVSAYLRAFLPRLSVRKQVLSKPTTL